MTEPTRPPDRPPVPRPRRSVTALVFAAFALLVVVGYAVVAFGQRELVGAPERDEVPASVRSSPGGYRSFHFWHSGYHGGK